MGNKSEPLMSVNETTHSHNTSYRQAGRERERERRMVGKKTRAVVAYSARKKEEKTARKANSEIITSERWNKKKEKGEQKTSDFESVEAF